MHFGEWMRHRLTKHGKSMAWMSHEIGASQSLLTRWRKGSHPRTEYFIKVCIVISKLEQKPIGIVVQEAAKTLGINI